MRIILFLFLLFFPVTASASELSDYENSLDRSCHIAADCAVMNVGNCCGYYPGCLNKNAKPDPERVQKICEKEAMSGVCGFPEISDCACINSMCQPAGNTPLEQ